jgi:peptidoglycan-associated lipoprotein
LPIFRLIPQESVMPHGSFRYLSLTVVVVLFVAVGACRRQEPAKPEPPPPAPPPVVTTTPPPPAPPPPAPPVVPAPPKVESEEEIFARLSLEELNRQKPLAEVYFLYDSAALTDAARAILEKNAAWLKRWTSTKITIEGHADNRGTNEYNLALGERRAASAREYLASLGVTADRMSIVSKGEEQPTCTEETESCWQQNRRGFFIITAK